MNLDAWKTTINQIIDESNQEPTQEGKQNILIAWRANLEKEPTSLLSHEIDEIVREVRTRLNGVLR